MRLPAMMIAMMVATAIPAFPQFHSFMVSGRCDRQSGAGEFKVRLPRETRTPPVIDAPYSAVEHTETVRTLPDGAHLISKSRQEAATWRDSSGRGREEDRGDLRNCNLVLPQIVDPVAGYYYLIDPVNHVAHRVPIVPALPRVRPASVASRPADSTFTSEQLGTKTISGVTVVGTRQTQTFPVGSRFGNDRPVARTYERWDSPHLGITVSEVTSFLDDVTTTELNDLSTAEPDPSLFQIPAGYKIVDETESFTIKVEPGNGINASPKPQ